MRWPIVVALLACNSSSPAGKPHLTLADARRGFHTKPVERPADHDRPDQPPPGVFELVSYDAPPGKLAAYVSPDPGDGKRHAAIIWIHGGDNQDIGDVWSERDPDNDQSAMQYREAGLVMMLPSLRGGNQNPGRSEGFLGEVDDVLAARADLAQRPYVDPQRIYLGGHSTGGTLVLLVAEIAPPGAFRAIVSLGPVGDVAVYGTDCRYCPFDMSDATEAQLRSPGRWLDGIQTPTFVIEGNQRGNASEVRRMDRSPHPDFVHFFVVDGTHFTILARVNRAIAGKLAAPAELALTDADLR